MDCVLLIEPGFPAESTAADELIAGLPFLAMKLVGQLDFNEFVAVIFGTDRMGVPKGMVEVIHGP